MSHICMFTLFICTSIQIIIDFICGGCRLPQISGAHTIAKGLFTLTVSVSISVTVSVKVYCANGNGPFDRQNGYTQCKFDGDGEEHGDGDGTCKQTFNFSLCRLLSTTTSLNIKFIVIYLYFSYFNL